MPAEPDATVFVLEDALDGVADEALCVVDEVECCAVVAVHAHVFHGEPNVARVVLEEEFYLLYIPCHGEGSEALVQDVIAGRSRYARSKQT